MPGARSLVELLIQVIESQAATPQRGLCVYMYIYIYIHVLRFVEASVQLIQASVNSCYSY